MENNINLIQKCRTNPVFFVEKYLGSVLWEKQREVLTALNTHSRVTFRSCHNIGKSYIASRAALWFLFSFKDSVVITTAPTWRQVENILWREIRSAYNGAKYDLGGRMLTSRVEIDDKWYAIGVSTDDDNSFAGIHSKHILFIVDESSGVNELIFPALEGSMSNEGAKLLLIGNPTSLSGTFYQSHRDKDYYKIHVSCFDTPNFTHFGITMKDFQSGEWEKKITGPMPFPSLITPMWAEERIRKWGEQSPLTYVRVLGEFPLEDQNALIPLHKIEAAQERLKVNESGGAGIGVDPSRFGSDKTVFVYRKGNRIIEIQKLVGRLTEKEIADKLVPFMAKYNYPYTFIDSIGVGAGLVDFVKAKYKNVIGFNSAKEPLDTEFFINARAEVCWNFALLFLHDEIAIPKDSDFETQAANIHYKIVGSGKIQIESKDEMKKRGLESPDVFDASAFSFLTPRSGGLESSTNQSNKLEEKLRPLTSNLDKKVF